MVHTENERKEELSYYYEKNYERHVHSAAEIIKVFHLHGTIPAFGIVLGSGLGDVADAIEDAHRVPYEDIPYFPRTTVEGHEGTLIVGKLEGVPVIGLKGRKHYYEVADQLYNNGILQTVFPVHVLAELGVPNYFVTNAAGGLNQSYSVGDAMIIRSHINLLPNSLLGRQKKFLRLDGTPVWRFQPMNDAYDPHLREMLLNQNRFGPHVHEGVYLAVTGPTFETEAESIAFRNGLFADAVGMSTAPEVIVARNRGMKAVGFSCITNKIAADGTNATNHEEVKAILDSEDVRKRLESLVCGFFAEYRKESGL
ncbi:MAG TPA: purine-nucleoside phosphorylase [Candidatus Nanoarchaeia archaeon]|nr:purine-nucleoside phosphorylase [Candidatus Nanoarchaeia archaeon]